MSSTHLPQGLPVPQCRDSTREPGQQPRVQQPVDKCTLHFPPVGCCPHLGKKGDGPLDLGSNREQPKFLHHRTLKSEMKTKIKWESSCFFFNLVPLLPDDEGWDVIAWGDSACQLKHRLTINKDVWTTNNLCHRFCKDGSWQLITGDPSDLPITVRLIILLRLKCLGPETWHS